MKADYDGEPWIWTDEDCETAYVDVKAKTATREDALTYLIDHGAVQAGVFDALRYEHPDSDVDPASIHFRGLDLLLPPEIVDDRGRIPRTASPRAALADGTATGMWRFDISVAAVTSPSSDNDA